MIYRKQVASVLGELTILCDDSSIIRLLFENHNEGELKKWLLRYTGETALGQANGVAERCAGELARYFGGERMEFTLPVKFYGSAFDRGVWNALRGIPYGETVSYQELGRRANLRGARAIGGGVGRNPVPVIVPCHRVVRSDGGLGGFSGGLEKKISLLSLEQSHRLH